MIIDVHTHIVPEHFPPVGSRRAGNRWPMMDHVEPGKANVMIAGRNFRTVLDRCWDMPPAIAAAGIRWVTCPRISAFPDTRPLARRWSTTVG